MFHNSKSRFILLTVLLFALLFSAACSPASALTTGGRVLARSNNPAPTATAVRPQTEVVAGKNGATLDAEAVVLAQEEILSGIYERTLPSVVHIRVTQKVQQQAQQDFFQFGFPGLPGFPFGEQQTPQQQKPQEFYRRGEGSGFVWDKEGHIVTNNHVVADADEVTVVFAGGTSVDATVLGTDPNVDLAVLQIDVPADKLAPVTVGDSDALKVGQMAVAIGNPFGLENTMTYGIVSALGRTIQSGTSRFSIPEVIQTDAPINPGNSGGPLLDHEGRVIGINTQIVSQSGSNAGIGFAVPVNIARQVVPVLIEKGSYDYAWLGISGQTLLPEVADFLNLPDGTQGALVIEVSKDGPADKAGLVGSDKTLKSAGIEYPLGGDIIVSIDDQPVQDMEDLITYLTGEVHPGDEVTLGLIRDGKEITVTVTLGTRPSPQELQQQMTPEATPAP